MKEILIGNIYRELKPGSTRHYNYFIYRNCNTCGNPYYAKKSGSHYSNYCSAKCAGRVRGRPVGTVLSAGTKQKIADGRTNKKQSARTKQAISETIRKIDFSVLPPRKYPTPVDDKHRKLKQVWWQLRYTGTLSNKWHSHFLAFKEWCLTNGYKIGLAVSRKDFTKPHSPTNSIIRTKLEHAIAVCRQVMNKGKGVNYNDSKGTGKRLHE